MYVQKQLKEMSRELCSYSKGIEIKVCRKILCKVHFMEHVCNVYRYTYMAISDSVNNAK